MARAFLRYPPEGDTRPDPLAAPVLERAAFAKFGAIKEWLQPRQPTLTDEDISSTLISAIRQGGADGFRASVHLKDNAGWPVDMDLCCLVRDSCNALALALKDETRAWVLRTGLRFPAKSEDTIEWESEFGKQFAGKVIAVDSGLACALVQPFDGLIRAGQPRRVHAESVVANTTTGEYAIPRIGPATLPAANAEAV